jgi:hypothetical protein
VSRSIRPIRPNIDPMAIQSSSIRFNPDLITTYPFWGRLYLPFYPFQPRPIPDLSVLTPTLPRPSLDLLDLGTTWVRSIFLDIGLSVLSDPDQFYPFYTRPRPVLSASITTQLRPFFSIQIFWGTFCINYRSCLGHICPQSLYKLGILSHVFILVLAFE